MFLHRSPVTHPPRPVPSVQAFAVLSAIESLARGILISVSPVVMYRIFEDARLVSQVYFIIGVLSLLVAISVPWLSRHVARRWLYSFAVIVYVISAGLCALADSWLFAIGLGLFTFSIVIVAVCFNAYVLDYINRARLGECETLRLFYSGASWSIGPFLGIYLMSLWKPAPFILSALASCVLLGIFWYYRLGDGKAIQKANKKPPNPFAYLNRFIHQPRLVAGWIFAVIRCVGWWVYVVYLPIYAVENGYSEQLGGALLSLSNAFLFLTPMMLKAMRGRIRLAVITGFICSGSMFLLAAMDLAGTSLSIGLLVLASFFLILLDICAGLPFLMAVRPSERSEMSAVYSTYRDVSGVITPGAASLLLLFAPLSAIFALTAFSFFACASIATRLHPRLGAKRELPLELQVVTEAAPGINL